jgi:hypothetical protein
MDVAPAPGAAPPTCAACSGKHVRHTCGKGVRASAAAQAGSAKTKQLELATAPAAAAAAAADSRGQPLPPQLRRGQQRPRPTAAAAPPAAAADIPAATGAAAPLSNMRSAQLSCAACKQSRKTVARQFLDCTDPACGVQVRESNCSRRPSLAAAARRLQQQV